MFVFFGDTETMLIYSRTLAMHRIAIFPCRDTVVVDYDKEKAIVKELW